MAAIAAVGLEALTDRRCGALSAGQIRRAGLARIVLAQRPVWLLDEPTASLDAASAGLVAGLIARHAAAGGTTLVATHEPIAVAGARDVYLGAPATGTPRRGGSA